MIFDFKDNTLYLTSTTIRMAQNINTVTKKPFKSMNEAKKWAKEYFGKELEFVEDKIDITDLHTLSELTFLNDINNDDLNNENLFEFRIHQYDTNNVIISKQFKTLNDLLKINIDDLQLNKGKYYFSISNLADVFFKKDNISFIIE